MTNLVVGGIVLVPIVVGLVQFLKYMGLPTKYAPLANAILVVLAVILVLVTQAYPEIVEPVSIVLTGLVLFLANCGFYETVKYVAGK
jgi:hypothetical protein